ncbi:serine protease [Arthrobacter sp. M4]|uniref:trypsin-like serine peptidase n=1 Tax=Arthrobacter sp. M4 TaxID=218160 RepID=UPI001CDC07D3|nr:hypothetical protein [Arthrobacter sp. M4]MCA4135580.1 hypothetical protein [Arthrobacter sp. M4]
MTRTRTLTSTLLTLSAATVLAVGSAGAAAAVELPAPVITGGTTETGTTGSATTEAGTTGNESSPGAAVVSGAGSTVASTAVAALKTVINAADYWTADRMRAAAPGEILAGKALALSRQSPATPQPVATGHPTTIEATRPSAVEGTNPTLRSQSPASTAGSDSLTRKVYATESSTSHIGKVFFTVNGADYVCSANAVTSANKSTIATAGHCVTGGTGSMASNFVFVPAYSNGSAPYGKWTAKSFYSPVEWSSQSNVQYDTAFAVINPLDGRSLTDVVGASGLAFNAPRGLDYKAYGYPAAPPFSGEALQSCSGTAHDDQNNPQFNTQGIPCTMTGGASGGPWFMGTSSSGYQNSVNSYGYGSGSSEMYAPYWGTVIQQSYQNASTAA